jgi:hypothetical protein
MKLTAPPPDSLTRQMHADTQAIVGGAHRWARLLKQQLSITIYRLLTRENKRPFFSSL